MESLKKLEQAIIYPYTQIEEPGEDSDEIVKLLCLTSRGSYVQVLQSESCKNALPDFPKVTLSDMSQYLESHFKTFLENKGTAGQYTLLCIGVSCLQLFAQNNFTGPFIGPSAESLLYKPVEESSTELIANLIINELLLDTEGVYSLVSEPTYLLFARVIFTVLKKDLFSCQSAVWWCIRYCFIHQKVSDENSPQLHNIIHESIEELINGNFFYGQFENELIALFNLEVSNIHLHYQNVKDARDCLAKAKDICGFDVSLAGALGKRTKWQSEMLPQLYLKVTYKDKAIPAKEVEEPAHLPDDFPKDLNMGDDTRLERILFRDQDEDIIPSLTPLEQNVLLTDLQLKLRAFARDVQTELELKVYIASLLQHPKNWCLQMCALVVRSRIEISEPRAMGRALCQIDECFMAIERLEPSRFERLKLLYSSLMISKWSLQQEVARMNMRLGNIKTALSIFEKLELWEDVIICNNELDLRSRSAAIINELLQKERTPRLLCLLGDATDDVTKYHEAWELSNHKSGRAQRCLGYYYYTKKDFKKAVEHYEKSVAINSLQYTVWQRLAYSYLMLEDWQNCASAYIRCTVLEPDSFECWNNLSQAYLRLNKTFNGWKALREALRCNTTNWRLWGNYMQVSALLGYMGQALHAYEQILQFKEKHVDTEILGCVVKAVVMGVEDPNGVSMKTLHKKASDLLGQLTRQVPTNPELWFLSATLVYGMDNPTQESKHTAMQYYRRAVAAAVQKPTWSKEKSTVQLVLMRGLRLMEVIRDVMTEIEHRSLLSELNSLKMLLTNALKNIKNDQSDIITEEIVSELKGPYEDLTKEVEWLKNSIMEARNS